MELFIVYLFFFLGRANLSSEIRSLEMFVFFQQEVVSKVNIVGTIFRLGDYLLRT